MNRFAYYRPSSVEDAVAVLAADPKAKPLAGGTNLVDLMKYDVENPSLLVDLNRLPLRDVEDLPAGGLRIGALVTNTDAAYEPRVLERFPLLSTTILHGASGQLRNAATMGGNVLQRTRCAYFYDVATPCNKRTPGTGCGAIGGINRDLAVLGASDQCIATFPSDMCVALAAMDAVVVVRGTAGERRIAINDFHRLPGDTPELDNVLNPGDLITAVELPRCDFGRHHTYLKLRDRHSYAFALVSVAVGLTFDGDNVKTARVALGGVAAKPWRVPAAEALLAGRPPNDAAFAAFAGHLVEGAQGQGENDFKIELARRAVVRALEQAVAGDPQSVVNKFVQ